jgi:hypothetical protein
MNECNDFGELSQPLNSTDRLIDEFIADCEMEAAKLEITVDYYLAEFV